MPASKSLDKVRVRVKWGSWKSEQGDGAPIPHSIADEQASTSFPAIVSSPVTVYGAARAVFSAPCEGTVPP